MSNAHSGSIYFFEGAIEDFCLGSFWNHIPNGHGNWLLGFLKWHFTWPLKNKMNLLDLHWNRCGISSCFPFKSEHFFQELVKIPGVSNYELRLLWHLFFLRSRKMHVVPWVWKSWFLFRKDERQNFPCRKPAEHGDVLNVFYSKHFCKG